MVPTGSFGKSNPIPMARTSERLRLHTSVVKRCEKYVGVGWSDVYKWPENAYMGRRHETPPWMIDMSKRFNAALRHSVGCVQDIKGYQGIPCEEAGWVNVEQILKYDRIWTDGQYLHGRLICSGL